MKTKKARLDWREGRRRRAWELKEAGWKQTETSPPRWGDAGSREPVAHASACAKGSRKGCGAIPPLVLPPSSRPEQLAQLPALLDRGAEAYGFRGQAWTCKRVGEVIRRTFGVTYDPSHVSRLLHRLGYSVQRPIERATQRDEAAIRLLVGAALASAQKKAADEGRGDRLGRPVGVLSAAPPRPDLGAPRQTPVLRVPLTRDHRSAIGALTPTSACSCRRKPRPTTAPMSSGSCACSCARCAGKLLVIWDGAPIHRGQPIKDFLARGAAKRIHLEQLPGYAPDLNPVEGIWNYLKCRELGNVCCQDFAELDPRCGAPKSGCATSATSSGLYHRVWVPCLALYTEISRTKGRTRLLKRLT